MKKIKIFISIVLAVLLLSSCTEDEKEPIKTDNVSPDNVTSIVVNNIPGGALITYEIPDDEDLLYVKAEYTLNDGRVSETRSSVYLNTLKVEGYGDTNEREVKIYCVDRSENASEPVLVKIQPQLPDVHKVKESLKTIADFGGVTFKWNNPNNAALAFILMAENEENALEVFETVYSGVTNGNYSLRGFDDAERKFAVVIRDRWQNYSDTIYTTIKPLFEQKLDKTKFQSIVLDNDHDWNAWGGKYENAYDDNIKTMCHTYAGTGWPQYFTIDLGCVARLSRVVIVQRQEEQRFHYNHGNPRLLNIYGMKEAPDQDGNFDNWYPLRVSPDNGCISIKPSEEGGTTSEDQEHLKNGDEYGFTINDPEVRYIRLVIEETWAKTGFAHFAEISFYGQIME